MVGKTVTRGRRWKTDTTHLDGLQFSHQEIFTSSTHCSEWRICSCRKVGCARQEPAIVDWQTHSRSPARKNEQRGPRRDTQCKGQAEAAGDRAQGLLRVNVHTTEQHMELMDTVDVTFPRSKKERVRRTSNQSSSSESKRQRTVGGLLVIVVTLPINLSEMETHT